MQDVADVREAYLSLGNAKKSPWTARLGRQELLFGDQRLVTGGDWFNAAKSFDGGRGSWSHGGNSITVLYFLPVVPVSGDLDKWNSDERLMGGLYSYRGKHAGLIEPYVFVKTVGAATAGAPNTVIYTYGARAVATIGCGVDYNLEAALQRGHVKAERMMASAAHYGV